MLTNNLKYILIFNYIIAGIICQGVLSFKSEPNSTTVTTTDRRRYASFNDFFKSPRTYSPPSSSTNTSTSTSNSTSDITSTSTSTSNSTSPSTSTSASYSTSNSASPSTSASYSTSNSTSPSTSTRTSPSTITRTSPSTSTSATPSTSTSASPISSTSTDRTIARSTEKPSYPLNTMKTSTTIKPALITTTTTTTENPITTTAVNLPTYSPPYIITEGPLIYPVYPSFDSNERNCYFKTQYDYRKLQWTCSGYTIFQPIQCYRCCYYGYQTFAACESVHHFYCCLNNRNDYQYNINLNNYF